MEFLFALVCVLAWGHFRFCVWVSTNSRSRSLDHQKRHFGVPWVFFLSIRGTISEDFGWRLNSRSLGAPQGFMRHFLGIINEIPYVSLGYPLHTLSWCCPDIFVDTPQLLLRYCLGVAWVLLGRFPCAVSVCSLGVPLACCGHLPRIPQCFLRYSSDMRPASLRHSSDVP